MLYQSAFAVMTDAVAYLVIELLTVILYEVVKCRTKEVHTGFGPIAMPTSKSPT